MQRHTFLLIVIVTIFAESSNGFPLDSESPEATNQSRSWHPIKKLQWNFSVELDQPLESNEVVFVTGDASSLGAWSPNRALTLQRDDLRPTRWSGSAYFAANSIVNFRYFIGVVDASGGVQIRKWETNLEGRVVDLRAKNIGRTDSFGVINGQKSITRGWLNNGYNILQLKLFRNPIKLDESRNDETIFVKVTPVDYDWNAETRFLKSIPSSGRANVEFIRMKYGNSKIRAQPKNGVPYETDDIVIFHITTNDLKKVAYKITLYGQDGEEPLGYQYLYPETIDGSEGSTELSLMSSSDEDSSIGTINIGYLLIKPLQTKKLSLRTTFENYWRNQWTELDAGHRGLGNSLELIKNAAPVIENTLESMRQSAEEGADMVEFDVQLTSDLVPIIYHDYVVLVSLNGTKPTSKDDLTELHIKDLTHEELKNLVTYQVVGSKVIEYASHNMEPRESYRLFPLFEDFLTKVDRRLAFDIEIKWPQKLYNGKMESIQTIDKNLYVDIILDMMLKHGCGRLSFFTSLDADICTLVQFKQNMYPSMFVGPSPANAYYDPRSDSLEEVINNAQAMGMLGIVPHTSNFMPDGSRLDLASDLGLKTFIWGADSNSTSSVDYFKSLGATGVIYDRIDTLIPEGKTSVFWKESDLPEFFDKQCS